MSEATSTPGQSAGTAPVGSAPNAIQPLGVAPADIAFVEAPKPWERQIDETVKAWNAFVIYRDLGEERGLAKVAEKLGVSDGNIAKWSAKNSWVQRIKAWEDEQDRQKRARHRKELAEMEERHASVARAMQNRFVEKLQTIKGSDLGSIGESLRWYTEAVRLERQAMGADLVNVHEEPEEDQEPPEETIFFGIDIDRM